MIQLNWSTLSPKITEVGTWLYLNGNYYWRGPGFTSMIMGGRVSTPTSPYIIDHRFSYKHQKRLHHLHKHHSSKHQFLSSLYETLRTCCSVDKGHGPTGCPGTTNGEEIGDLGRYIPATSATSAAWNPIRNHWKTCTTPEIEDWRLRYPK